MRGWRRVRQKCRVVHNCSNSKKIPGSGGFEPPKRVAGDLKSPPLARLGHLPYTGSFCTKLRLPVHLAYVVVRGEHRACAALPVDVLRIVVARAGNEARTARHR